MSWLGMHGHAGANYLVQEADCVIALGSRFDDRTTGNTEFYAPEATEKKQIIHVDIEPKQFNKSVNSHYNIHCDVKTFLNDINHMIKFNVRKNNKERVKELKDKYKFKHNIPENNKINTPKQLNLLIIILSKVINLQELLRSWKSSNDDLSIYRRKLSQENIFFRFL